MRYKFYLLNFAIKSEYKFFHFVIYKYNLFILQIALIFYKNYKICDNLLRKFFFFYIFVNYISLNNTITLKILIFLFLFS